VNDIKWKRPLNRAKALTMTGRSRRRKGGSCGGGNIRFKIVRIEGDRREGEGFGGWRYSFAYP
jgi:hypothetical protein